MINRIPEGSIGVATVEHFTVTKNLSMLSSLRGEYCPEGVYACLRVNGGLMMSDTPMEQQSNYDVCRQANGDVLIAGLGLGMILTVILDKPEVKSVTVIEKYQDVIDLIGPHVKSPKLTIICADIFEWQPEKARRWDTIYFDIWPDKCTDNLDEMTTLHRRFKSKVNRDNPQCWMGSWCQEELRYLRRRNRWR